MNEGSRKWCPRLVQDVRPAQIDPVKARLGGNPSALLLEQPP